jgi:hypothetical protein
VLAAESDTKPKNALERKGRFKATKAKITMIETALLVLIALPNLAPDYLALQETNYFFSLQWILIKIQKKSNRTIHWKFFIIFSNIANIFCLR